MKTKISKKQVIISIISGIFVGGLNGFLGGGAGMICVPLLEKLYGFDNKTAHASTMLIVLPLSLVSSIIYMLNNEINYINLLYVSLGAILGAVLGAVLLKKLNNNIIRVIFLVIMFIAGFKMVI